MPREELARHREHARTLHALHLGPASRMLADLHPERPTDLVQIVPVEEGMRQAIDQTQRDLLARALQCLVQQDTLPVGDRAVGEAVHDQEWRRLLANVGDRTRGPDAIRRGRCAET